MIRKVRFDEIAEIFTGVRVKRYQKGKGLTREHAILKKTYSENSSKLDVEYEEVSDEINEKFFSRKNDIVILLAGSKVSKIEEEGIIIPMYYAVVRVRPEYDVDFIFHLLKSDIFPRELHKIEEGTTLKIIKTTHLKSIYLPVPDLETQRNYGKLFNLMDKRINLNLELAELEKQIEKSIINEILVEDEV
ncbi:MAG: restriction endonuclease subunit S [Methanobrevibacter sp.]|nr:restriction endonuclease subunit S [Methanobrevibacter sp.]